MRRHIFDENNVPEAELGEWVGKFLKHYNFRTPAQQLGKVVRVSPSKLACWELHAPQMRKIEW